MTTRYVLAEDYAAMDGAGRGAIVRGFRVDPPDFPAMFARGVRVVGIRVLVVWYDAAHRAWRMDRDPCWERDSAAARAAGMTVIPYVFPSLAKGAPSAEDQMGAAIAEVQRVGYQPGVDLPLCLDVEAVEHTGHTNAEMFALVLAMLRVIIRELGAAACYTSQNVWWSLGMPNDPLLADVLAWIKTAYALAAGQPIGDWRTVPDAHVGELASDPHDYHRIPDPWRDEGCWFEQVQGDARIDSDGVRQADIDRWRIAAAGDHGPHVRGLQRRLGVAQTGTYDDDTVAAARALQAARGLDVDGVAGPRTVAAAWAPAQAT